MKWPKRVARFALDTLLILLAGSVCSAILFRFTPGSGVDARELQSGLSDSHIAELRAEREKADSLTGQSVSYFIGVLRGDLGSSLASGAPVGPLVLDRLPRTAYTVLAGSSSGFIAGVLAALVVVLLSRRRAVDLTANVAALTLLSVPAGLLVLLAILSQIPLEVAVAAAVVPRAFLYASRLLQQQSRAAYVVNATAAGISRFRIAVWHVLPAVRSEIAAIAGFCVVTALAATIPAEVLSGTPGIGQLAWRSAMDRDLPVLLAVTMCMIVFARAVTLISSVPVRDTRLAS
ncbi:MAG: ABC transporter permease subunit [Bryobacteraceae bacterium]|nr:ABC transporter permease subunit [Bryobacteraceae bacterium]